MNGENWVVKSNALVEAKGNFTPLELKVLLGLISEIKLEDKDLYEYDLDVKEFQNLVGTSAKNFYSEMLYACQKLTGRTLTVESEIDSDNSKKLKKKKVFEIMNYFSYAKYIDGESKIKIAINPYFKPYLVELKGNFTQYQLKNILTLKSQHAIRIYELTKPVEGTAHQKRTILVKDLKEILGIEGKYKSSTDFDKYVLKVAKKEICELTDIMLTYEKIKKGRNIHAIEFHVKTKEYVRTQQQAYYDEIGTESADLIREKVGLPKSLNNVQIMELYEIASSMTEDLKHIDRFEYMRRNYVYIQDQKYKSLFGYYKKALENDYDKACLKVAKEKGLI